MGETRIIVCSACGCGDVVRSFFAEKDPLQYIQEEISYLFVPNAPTPRDT